MSDDYRYRLYIIYEVTVSHQFDHMLFLNIKLRGCMCFLFLTNVHHGKLYVRNNPFYLLLQLELTVISYNLNMG